MMNDERVEIEVQYRLTEVKIERDSTELLQWDSDRPPFDTMCLGSPKVSTLNSASIRLAVFVLRTYVNVLQTD